MQYFRSICPRSWLFNSGTVAQMGALTAGHQMIIIYNVWKVILIGLALHINQNTINKNVLAYLLKRNKIFYLHQMNDPLSVTKHLL